MIALTGWLPHTTRAALSRLRSGGQPLLKSTRDDGSTAYRIIAAELDEPKPRRGLVRRKPADAGGLADTRDLSDAELIESCLIQVVVHPDALHLELTVEERRIVRVAWSPNRSQRHREIIVPPGSDRIGLRPMKVEDRSRILKAIATARSWIDDLVTSRITDTDAIAIRESCSERSVRMTLSLAQLSPRIVRALIDGRLPRGIGIKSLAELPLSWADQEHALGF